jgi:putative methyltransferase (TIGR04325 family)
MRMRPHHHPPLRWLAQWVLERRLLRQTEFRGMQYGVFDSFAAASEWCARRRIRSGYDLDHEWWLKVQSRLHITDYPMLFWLNRALTPQSRVADFGGSVGVSYYALVSHLEPFAEWRVCELPEVVVKGLQLAKQRSASRLHFTTQPQDLDAHDVWFTAGAVQYIETPLQELLGELRQPPTHLLINRIPMHPAMEFWTLQHTGRGVTPCRVFQVHRLFEGLASLGYERVDEWVCPFHSLHIPLHPQHYVANLRGYYFRRGGRTRLQ